MDAGRGVKAYPALKVLENGQEAISQMVSEETSLTIYINGKELVTMLCSPVEQHYLALGFLVSEGMIKRKNDLGRFEVDSERGLAWAEADSVPADPGQAYFRRCLSACCGRGRAESYFANDVRVIKHIDSQLTVSLSDINKYARMLEEQSATHKVTNGVHNGAVAAGGRLLYMAEDIGRHNVFDKLYGKCLEEDVAMDDKVLVFSGRVSSEIILKASKMGVPVVVARSVPTSMAIELADELGITLIGAAKGDWFIVYTHEDRVVASTA